MYGRSKKILALLLFFFVAEVASIVAVVWQAIGPNSSFRGAPDFSILPCLPILTQDDLTLQWHYKGACSQLGNTACFRA